MVSKELPCAICRSIDITGELDCSDLGSFTVKDIVDSTKKVTISPKRVCPRCFCRIFDLTESEARLGLEIEYRNQQKEKVL